MKTEIKWHRNPEGATYLTSYRYKGGSYAGTITASNWADANRKCTALGIELTGLADINQYPEIS